MRSILELDKIQLNRIEQAIAALIRQPIVEQQRKRCLLQALNDEKEELFRTNPAIRSIARQKAA